jgi:hypothetical protein
MSERLKSAHWVQNIMHDPRVLFIVNDKTRHGIARLTDQEKDAKLRESLGITKKYPS